VVVLKTPVDGPTRKRMWQIPSPLGIFIVGQPSQDSHLIRRRQFSPAPDLGGHGLYIDRQQDVASVGLGLNWAYHHTLMMEGVKRYEVSFQHGGSVLQPLTGEHRRCDATLLSCRPSLITYMWQKKISSGLSLYVGTLGRLLP
jgi:hypothetical protein